MVRRLLDPDDDLTQGDPAYSPPVAIRLRFGYEAARRHRFEVAAAHAVACLGERMAPRQLRRVHYLWAMGLAETFDFSEAARHAAQVLDMATDLGEWDDYIDVGFLCAQCEAGQRKLVRAVEFAATSLECLADSDGSQPSDTALQLDLLLDLAYWTFGLGEADECRGYLDRADRLIAHARAQLAIRQGSAAVVPHPFPLQAAFIEWYRALLARWSGYPLVALRHAEAAATVVLQRGAPQTRGRIQMVLADIAMDIADSFASHRAFSASDRFIEMAGPLARQALDLCAAAGDTTGEGQARLAVVRHDRLSGGGSDRQRDILRAYHAGRRERDHGLIGQALTAEGDEWLAQGEVERARHAYSRAMDALHDSDMGALRVWPRRALLRLSEMDGGDR